MKNIHVLPTEKPTILFVNNEKLLLAIGFAVGTKKNKGHNIYITSDGEIKEDYVIAYGVVIKVMMFDKETLYFVNGTKAKREECQKIILTTDQDLIKDGVQAIDYEFLEWFVKNPSCESVEVENEKYDISTLTSDVKKYPNLNVSDYKIIIPKEIGFRVENGRRTETYCQEAIRKEYKFRIGSHSFSNPVDIGGQQQSYTEEDMKIAFYANMKDWILFEEFIEQFKK